MQKFTQQKGRWSQGKMTLINRRSSGVCDVFISPAAFWGFHLYCYWTGFNSLTTI